MKNCLSIYIVCAFIALFFSGCVNLNKEFYSNIYILSLKNDTKKNIECIVTSKEISKKKKVFSIAPYSTKDIYNTMSPITEGVEVIILDEGLKKSYKVKFEDFSKNTVKTKVLVYDGRK